VVFGEEGLIVGSQDQALRREDDLNALWSQVGVLIRGQSTHDFRLDRIDAGFGAVNTRLDATDARFDGMDARFDRVEDRLGRVEDRLGRVEGRLGHIEGDMAETKERLGSLERATERGFNRIDARLEELFAWIKRDELMGS
jgi:septal ring factor EnvC (AmiA/AmiB activator)